jgi:hypothetical protein
MLFLHAEKGKSPLLWLIPQESLSSPKRRFLHKMVCRRNLVRQHLCRRDGLAVSNMPGDELFSVSSTVCLLQLIKVFTILVCKSSPCSFQYGPH